jgi:hypothetical protein
MSGAAPYASGTGLRVRSAGYPEMHALFQRNMTGNSLRDRKIIRIAQQFCTICFMKGKDENQKAQTGKITFKRRCLCG